MSEPQRNRSRSRSRNNNRSRSNNQPRQERPAKPAAKPGLMDKIKSIFGLSSPPTTSTDGHSTRTRTTDTRSQNRDSNRRNDNRQPRNRNRSDRPRQTEPQPEKVTEPRLYVGNLSYETTEEDLEELFGGVGTVISAEIIYHRYNMKSKGFAFVTLSSIDQARRAVTELHNQDFMGRSLIVSAAKSQGPYENTESSNKDYSPYDSETQTAS